jgi:hypothetical protein
VARLAVCSQDFGEAARVACQAAEQINVDLFAFCEPCFELFALGNERGGSPDQGKLQFWQRLNASEVAADIFHQVAITPRPGASAVNADRK